MKIPHSAETDPLETILGGLRYAEPSPEFETRLLKVMEEQALELVRRDSVERDSWRPGLFGFVPRRALAFAFAGVAGVLFLLLINPKKPSRSGSESAVGAATASVRAAPVVGPEARVQGLARPARVRPRFVASLVKPSTVLPSPVEPSVMSYPAPPMPLTAQERLLLRIAHRDAPQTLAGLTPERFAAEQAADDADYQEFFPPPTPVEYPTLTSQVNPSAPIPTRTHGATK